MALPPLYPPAGTGQGRRHRTPRRRTHTSRPDGTHFRSSTWAKARCLPGSPGTPPAPSPPTTSHDGLTNRISAPAACACASCTRSASTSTRTTTPRMPAATGKRWWPSTANRRPPCGCRPGSVPTTTTWPESRSTGYRPAPGAWSNNGSGKASWARASTSSGSGTAKLSPGRRSIRPAAPATTGAQPAGTVRGVGAGAHQTAGHRLRRRSASAT